MFLQRSPDRAAPRPSYSGVVQRDLWLRSRPSDMDLLRHLAFALAQCGRHDEAARHAARACELKPDDPRAWSDQGCIAALRGDVRGSVIRYSTAIDIDRDFAVGWHNLGVSLAVLGDPRGAFRALRNAHLLDQRRADTCRALGELLVSTGLTEAALASFARAEELEGVA